MQISRIRLSDKTSRLHPRHVVPKPAQAYEPEVPVKVREWISPALASPDLMLDAQPPAQPHSGVVVDRPVRFIVIWGVAPQARGYLNQPLVVGGPPVKTAEDSEFGLGGGASHVADQVHHGVAICDARG